MCQDVVFPVSENKELSQHLAESVSKKYAGRCLQRHDETKQNDQIFQFLYHTAERITLLNFIRHNEKMISGHCTERLRERVDPIGNGKPSPERSSWKGPERLFARLGRGVVWCTACLIGTRWLCMKGQSPQKRHKLLLPNKSKQNKTFFRHVYTIRCIHVYNYNTRDELLSLMCLSLSFLLYISMCTISISICSLDLTNSKFSLVHSLSPLSI